MRIHHDVFEHPTQASRLTLNVYEQQVSADAVAADDEIRGVSGYLVTEAWLGSSKVVRTLGFFRVKDEAMACVRERAETLQKQSWRPVPSAA